MPYRVKNSCCYFYIMLNLECDLLWNAAIREVLFLVILNSSSFYFLFQADLQANYSNSRDSDGRSILSDGCCENYSS